MAEFCERRNLPINRIGKVLVPVNVGDSPQLELLAERAAANGIPIERLDQQQLKELEPEVRSATGKAIFVPSTSVVSSSLVMKGILAETKELGAKLHTNAEIVSVDVANKLVRLRDQVIAYGHVINASGLHADKVAHLFGVGHRYTLLPFKGIYWKLKPESGIKVNHLVYPVPDLRVPFLGVHTTTAIDGTIYLGPTAVPAFGRENYRGFKGITATEFTRICMQLSKQVILGREGFRRLAWQEGRRYFKPWFAKAGQALLPRLQPQHLAACDKVGIRAQMLDRSSGKLVTDFLVERGEHSTHILNAISPAFTSAFPFARFVIDNYIIPER